MGCAGRWIERREPSLYWKVDAEWADSLAALGWPRREAVERALRDAAATGRTATAILALPGRSERIHLRPVRHGGWLAPLWREVVWGPGRAAAELRATAQLRAAGAPVPRPVLLVARRGRGPLWTAVLGTEHVEGARDGIAWLAVRPARESLVRGARAAGAAIRRFHDAGGSHADLHLKNLLLRERAGETEVLVIDLDRACAEVLRLSPRYRLPETARRADAVCRAALRG